ncbi:MAG: pseudouridine synthase [Edaphocola sp.]
MSKQPFRYGERAPKKFDDKKGEKSFRKPQDGQGERPFPAGKKPFRKSFDKPFDGERKGGFKKPFNREGGEDRPFRKSFDKPFDGERKGGFKKPFNREGGEDRPFRKSFDKPFDGERRGGFKKPFNREGGEDRPFRKSFDKPFDGECRGGFKKKFEDGKDGFGKRFDREFSDHKKGKFDEDHPKKPNRYADAFGKLDDDELVARKKKKAKAVEDKASQPEVTFTKELESRWDEAPVEKKFGKSDIIRKPQEYDEEGKPVKRHDAKTRFKRQFDNENEYEQAYNNIGGKKAETPTLHEEDGPMPLNKFIAHCDVCSRRDAVALVKDGKVTVNGAVVTEPGFKVNPTDAIALNGTPLTIQKNLVYILMNKPKGFITTTDDPKGRRTVIELIDGVIDERVFPVGRLDRNTTGLLLLTNDGELTQKLSHPKYNIRKVYKATLSKNLSKEDFDKIKEGVLLEDGPAPVDQLEYLDKKNEIGLEIHSGKNRIVRRIFESLGYEVEKLDRVMYAGLTKKNILRGKWRLLTKQEVINLKHIQ